jgi:Outer membrane lipoprotein-sorting protein
MTKGTGMVWTITIIAGLLWSVVILPIPSIASDPSASTSTRARQILREVDDLWRGRSSHGFLSMVVKTAHYTRRMRMEGWSKGKEYSLVRIIEPLREKGTATLKYRNDIFTYLPKTDRTIRLTSGMMMGSWMGSHFTNDDLVKESRLEEDYDPAITYEGERDGESVVEFALAPKPTAAVVWGKVLITVRAADHIPVASVYFDEDMAPVRTISFSKIREMNGRRIPTVLRVVPVDKPGEYTELIYEQMRFNIDLDDAFFSLAQLRRM